MADETPAAMGRDVLFAVFAFAPLGCSVYEHEVDIRVRDPHRVWIEAGPSGTRVDPAGGAAGAWLPGTHDRVVRQDNGTLAVGGGEVVRQSGALPSPPSTLDETSRRGDVFRIPECYRQGRRGSGCRRNVILATPWDNVTVAREADVPVTLVGILEIVAGVGAATGGVLAARAYPYASGGSLLLAAGGIGIVAGVIQLLQPVQNERDLLP
jgi:hypothetical protein